MVIFLITVVLWTVMGTATFRRVGHKAIEIAPKHSEKCNLNKKIYKNLGPDYDKCVKCNQYRSIIRQYGHRDHYTLKKVSCKFEGDEPRWDSEVCDCQGHSISMFGPAVMSYMFWPLFLLGYGYVNAQKKFLDYKGEDWNFFVPAKMVQTKNERIAQLEKNIKELERVTDMSNGVAILMEKQDG
jgi:hypothetical protein